MGKVWGILARESMVLFRSLEPCQILCAILYNPASVVFGKAWRHPIKAERAVLRIVAMVAENLDIVGSIASTYLARYDVVILEIERRRATSAASIVFGEHVAPHPFLSFRYLRHGSFSVEHGHSMGQVEAMVKCE